MTYPPNVNMARWIREQFPPDYIGYCVDVGSSDGVSINSTLGLEQARWTVLSVDANPEYLPVLKKYRAFIEICAVASTPQESATFHVHRDNPEAYSALKVADHPDAHAKPEAQWGTITVPVRTLEQLLEKWEFPRLDVLCVDVEGGELDVIEGLDFAKWHPHVVVVEAWSPDAPVLSKMVELGYTLKWKSRDNYCYRRAT